MAKKACPKCHALQARRIKQEGFLQQSVLGRLGFYPWTCRFCKANFLLRDRGIRTKTSPAEEEPHSLAAD